MCYSLPGPRCSSHALIALHAAQKAYSIYATESNMEKIIEAQKIYDSTPKGLKELQNLIDESPDDVQLPLRFEAAKMLRAQHLKDMLESKNLGMIPSGKIRKGINDPHDPANKEMIEGFLQEGEYFHQHITPEIAQSFHWYTMFGSESTNALLSKGFESQEVQDIIKRYDRLTNSETPEAFRSKVTRHIEHLDEGMKIMPEREEPRVLYRAIHIPPDVEGRAQAFDEATKKFVLGDIVSFPAYLSTTIDSDLMLYQAHKNTDSRPDDTIVFEILSKKGVVLQDPQKRHRSNIQFHEKEVLLPRNVQFKVVKVIKKASFESTRPQPGVYNHDGWLDTFSKLPKKARMTVVQLVDADLVG